jgi:sulfatase maturation enzyme AslB (radical SAM superfamily)
MRHGTIWSNILKNLDTLKTNNINIKIAPTVSVFNVLDIAEICKFYLDSGYVSIDDFGINVLDSPQCYSIQTLHPELKLVAKYRIADFIEKNPSMTAETKSKFNYLINFMMAEDSWSENKFKFTKITTQLDIHRGECFLKTFPELEKHIL